MSNPLVRKGFKLTAMLKDIGITEVKSSRTPPKATKKDKVAEYADRSVNSTKRKSIKKVLEAIPDQFAKVETKPGELVTVAQANALMQEKLLLEEALNIIQGGLARLREQGIDAIDAQYIDEGVDPDEAKLLPGRLNAPEFGRAFSKEGGGRNDPTWDLESLREQLGDRAVQVFDTRIIPEQIIPEQVVTELNTDRLVELANRDPEVLEIIRSCLTEGTPKTVSFTTREIKDSD